MAKAPTNMAKSVKDRLLNIARKEGRVLTATTPNTRTITKSRYMWLNIF